MDFIDHRSTAQFTFLTSATDEKMRINADGDLLVGISTPFDTSGITLDATGALGVDGHITVATGATYDIGTATNKFRDLYLSGDINVAGVSTSGDLTVGGSLSVTTDATVTGSLTVSTDATITNDLTVSNDATIAGDLTVSTNAVIAGDLTVNGTTTTINTETLDVKDKNITLNYGGDTTSADGAGITIEDAVSAGTDATILWDGGSDTFDFSHAIDVTGTITADNNLTIQNSAAYGSIELGGVSGGFIDIKRPFSDDFDLRLIAEGDGGVINVASGELTIQRAGAAKLATTSTGIAVTGNATFADNGKAIFGGGSDLQIYHDGSNSYIWDNGTGLLQLRTNGSEISLVGQNGTEFMGRFQQDGAVKLYYDNSQKFSTTSTGIDVTGVITTDGITTSADINFGDNDKAVFGAGSDLQIYHDGGNSLIEEAGVGNLIIRGSSNVDIQPSGGGAYMARFAASGASSLYHNGSEKLATTSTGIDVTGSVVSDGLTVDGLSQLGTVDIYDNGALSVIAADSSHDLELRGRANQAVNIVSNGTSTASFANNGDISFYEDTGTTAKFFWDASAESLGIGNSSPLSFNQVGADTLVVGSGSGEQGITIYSGTSNNGVLAFADGTTTTQQYQGYIGYNHSSNFMRFFTGATERMRIDSSGNVGIGSQSPAAKLDIVDTSADVQMRVYKNDGTKNTRVTVTADDSGAKIHYRDADNAGALRFNNNLGEVMRITADTTSVGIGLSSPSSQLHIGGATNGTLRVDTSASGYLDLSMYTNGGFIGTSASQPLRLGTVNTERMRIDASGRVGIGTSSPAGKATVKVGDDDGNVTTWNSNYFLVSSGDSTISQALGIGVNTANDYAFLSSLQPGTAWKTLKYKALDHIFDGANDTERMRIDSSGNLLVSKTSNDNSTAGVVLRDTGEGSFVASGQRSGLFNRLSSDGEIINFRKDSATVGSIGTRAGFLTIGEGAVGLLFQDANSRIEPTNMATLAATNGVVDIGGANQRFKDLYLSGTVFTNTGFNLNAGINYNSDSSLFNYIGVNSTAVNNNATYKWRTGITGNATGHSLTFSTIGRTESSYSERMRIDASGNLLVGTTTTTAGNEGMVYFNGSSLRVTRDSDEPLNLDRLTTNGSLVDFKKDGTTVGSIGSYLGAYAYIGSTGGTDTHIGFVNGAVRPATATGAVLDATLDLGNSSSRFKDLYLSGTAYTNALGVGTTSPDVKVDIVDTAADVQLRVYKFDGTNNTRLALTADDSGAKIHYRDATNGGALRFNNNAGEMARFDASGNLLVGTTDSTPYNNNAGSTADNGIALSEAGWLAASRYQGTVAFLNRTDNDGDIAVFRKDGSTVGSISVAGSTTSYNTSSDQRLKENIADADDAGSKVDAIQVRKFDWKVDGSHQDYGMVAQELNTVAPEAVSAPEDPEEMMGVDYSKLVPMLVKEIQSLRARVAQLETN